MMKEYWEQRYAMEDYAYGTEPNRFFKEQLKKLKPGKLLFPADGEGRNGVYAATKNWEVTCFDLSEEARRKAMKLASASDVKIDFHIGSFEDMNFANAHFDAIVLVYAHLAGPLIKPGYQLASQWLKPGGHIILEGFSERHLEYRERDPSVGGPQDMDMLFSVQKIQAYFPDLKPLMLEEQEVELREGLYHNGYGSVIRYVGQKPD